MPKTTTAISTIVARAVIVQRGKILLTRNIKKNWYFLPGGHVETGEAVITALDRELHEEIGTGLTKPVFVGVHDNRYLDSYTGMNQEIGIIFSVKLRKHPKNLEDHITAEWVPIGKLKSLDVKPAGLGKLVTGWLKNKKPFWMTS